MNLTLHPFLNDLLPQLCILSIRLLKSLVLFLERAFQVLDLPVQPRDLQVEPGGVGGGHGHGARAQSMLVVTVEDKAGVLLKETLGGYVEFEARERQAEDANHIIALTEILVHDPQYEVPV